MAGVPHGENVWKTIILGIVITVAGYLIVHFITDKKDHRKEEKEKKEANENTWKSANDYILSASKKFENIACFSCDYELMKTEMMRELEQDCNSLRNLKEEKLLDEKLKTVIDRTISRFEGLKPAFTAFIDSALSIRNANPENPDTSRINRAYRSFINTKMRLDTADNQEVDRLLAAVNKEYHLELKREEIRPEKDYNQLPGNWTIECKINLELGEDGKVTVKLDGESINGTWKRDDDLLKLNLDNGEKLDYIILQISNTVMTIMPDLPDSTPLGVCRVK